MNFINWVPKWLYAVLVAALLATAGGLAFYSQGLRVAVAHAGQRYSQLEAKGEREAKDRERIGREDANEVKRMQAKHASMQQENVHAFHAKEAADGRRERDLRTELDRLRDDVKKYAGGGGEANRDPNTCRSDRDRSERLGAALEEALGLQGEAEIFIRKRDREVKLLKDTIGNDRALTPPAKEQK